jgi:dTDP-4-amino-4,6-dideoxygalactose transaminase
MPEKTIPSFRAEFSESEISEVLAATEKILRSGWLILGGYTKDFEATMAAIAQTEYAVAVNSGSTALEIIYKTLEVKDRQVLIPTNTNFATAAAAVYAGAKVEFYDNGVYPDTVDLMRRLTKDTAAVVVVHIGGYITPDMMRIVERCQELGVPLVEDCAHAHGAQLDGKAAGSFGRAAAFSFFPTKTLTTSEGGLIATHDAAFATMACQYRDQGKNQDGVTHEVWGNSWRMTEIGAALGAAQAKHIDTDNARRAEIISRYKEALADTVLQFPEQSANSLPAGYKCIAVLPEGIDRNKLKAALLARGVQLGKEVYERPLHHQPIFKQFAADQMYPIADDFAARHICLPLWRFMEDQDVETVIKELRAELI